MPWVEQEHESRKSVTVTAEKDAKLSKARDEALPALAKEAEKTVPFAPVRFQPVKGPGTYEAEFAAKSDDLIFHFWPYGFHKAQREERNTPHFKKGFEEALRTSLQADFGKSFEMSLDSDMGAWFVRIPGWGARQFFHEVSVRFCERLHGLLSQG